MTRYWTNRRGFLRDWAKGLPLIATAPWMELGRANAAVDTSADPTQSRSLVFEEPFTEINANIWNGGPKATTGPSGFYGRSAFAPLSGVEGFKPYEIVQDFDAVNSYALQISAKYIGHDMNIVNYYGNMIPDYQWVSGNLQMGKSNGAVSKGWDQGYFEARMKLPDHPIAWPAFWLLNRNGIKDQNRSIEVDIIENKGYESNLYGAYLHEWGQPGEHHEGTGVPTPVDIKSGYYRYGVLIEDGKCIPYFERKPIINPRNGQLNLWTISRTSEMRRDGDVFWPLLTLALLADMPTPTLTEDQKLVHMRVDYFRVYA